MTFNNVMNWKMVKKDYDGLIICHYLGNKIWGSKATKFAISGDVNKIN